MKKKLLSFILAICLIMPCAFMLSACGGNPPDDTPTHTHNWATTWSKNETEHWLTCDGCDEKKDKANHTLDNGVCSVCNYNPTHTHEYSNSYLNDSNYHWQKCEHCYNTTERENHNYIGNTCSVCGYETTGNTDNLPVVANVRDLEIITLRTNRNGFAALVKLPDGKNMLIDSGMDNATAEIEVDEMLLAANITTLDYFVTTTSSNDKTGAADLVFDYYQVNNFYKPEISSSVTPTDAYLTAVQKAEAEPNCTITTIGESNCDISYTFKDNSNNRYTYEIDFMIPVAASSATNIFDNTVAVSIKYKDKNVLITAEATNKNIDAYCTKYGNQKDVDVLITSYLPSEQNAITASANRGTDFLAKVNFESSDYAIIVPIAGEADLSTLETKLTQICGQSNMHSLSTARGLTTAVTKITSAGVVSVTSR